MHNEKKPTPKVPQTGDSSHAALWLALLGLSGIGAVTVLLMRKRKNKRQGAARSAALFSMGKKSFSA